MLLWVQNILKSVTTNRNNLEIKKGAAAHDTRDRIRREGLILVAETKFYS